MKALFTRLLVEEAGQDLLEYALLTTFIGLVGVLGLNAISSAINFAYGTWNTGVNALWEPPNPI